MPSLFKRGLQSYLQKIKRLRFFIPAEHSQDQDQLIKQVGLDTAPEGLETKATGTQIL